MTQYASLFNDRGLVNVYAVFHSAQQVWNGSAFVNYSHGSDSLYANAMTDANGTGYYTVLFPEAIVTNGSYPFTIYVQTGGSPDLTLDTLLGSGNIDVPSTPSSIPVATAELIDRLRILANDYSDSNRIYFESGAMPNPPDGTRTMFKLQNSNITIGSVYASYDTTVRTQAGFTINYQDGIITFSSAPAADSGLTFDYTFEFYTDTDYTEFLNEAAAILVYDDPDDVVAGLIPSLMQFGLYSFFIKRAASYAYRFASSGGTASEQVSTVTGEFQKLAQIAFKRGEVLRDNYYNRAGRQKAPGFSQSRVRMDPYTPRR